ESEGPVLGRCRVHHDRSEDRRAPRRTRQWRQQRKGSGVLMVRAASTYIHVHERLQTTRLDALVRGGAQAIEIFGARQHFDYTHRVHVKEIAAWFTDNQITPHSLHAPLYTGVGMGRDGQPQLNLVDKEKPARVVAMDEMKRAL